MPTSRPFPYCLYCLTVLAGAGTLRRPERRWWRCVALSRVRVCGGCAFASVNVSRCGRVSPAATEASARTSEADKAELSRCLLLGVDVGFISILRQRGSSFGEVVWRVRHTADDVCDQACDEFARGDETEGQRGDARGGNHRGISSVCVIISVL